MKPNLPVCCSPVAFSLLSAAAEQIASPDALLSGAVAVAAHQMEEADVSRLDAMLQRYADLVRSRVRGDQPQALLAHLHELLFEQEQFTGDKDDYYNPLNSYVPAVLHTKRGRPITLCLIYKIVAERLGLRAWGVGLPGHFLAAVELDGAPMLVDAFSAGRVLSVEEAHARMCEVLGPEAEWSDELLRPVSNKVWLTRMLQNLLTSFGTSGHYADVAAILEMEMLLWPGEDRLQRDLALVLARLGLAQPASVWLNQYLQNNPDDPQRTDLQQLLEVLET